MRHVRADRQQETSHEPTAADWPVSSSIARRDDLDAAAAFWSGALGLPVADPDEGDGGS